MDALLVGGVFGGVFCFPGISPWIVVFIVGYLVFSAGLFRCCYWWESWAFRFRVGVGIIWFLCPIWVFGVGVGFGPGG